MPGAAPAGFMRREYMSATSKVMPTAFALAASVSAWAFSALRSVGGSRPSRTAACSSCAFTRAWESDTAVRPAAGPSPILSHLAAAHIAKQPELRLAERTNRYGPPPSPWRPALIPFSTCAAASPFARRGIVPPSPNASPHHRQGMSPVASERTRKEFCGSDEKDWWFL